MSNVLESLVSTLPPRAQPYAKTYAAAALTGASVLVGLTDVPAWVAIVLAVATAPVVFATPNLDPQARAQDESTMPPDHAWVDDLRRDGEATYYPRPLTAQGVVGVPGTVPPVPVDHPVDAQHPPADVDD